LRLNAGKSHEPWLARLTIPNYRIKDAARYAEVSTQTIANWHGPDASQLLSEREDRAALSYMQLIEIAVVAAFRKAGVKLKDIKAARAYVQKQIEEEYPFAVYKFKTDGKYLLMDYAQIDKKGKDSLLEVNKHGQLAWAEVLNRLKEFEYDPKKKFVSQWHVAGTGSPIIIDPRLSFGAPTVNGTPTWAIRDRWIAGEAVEEIAEDFELPKKHVVVALGFEGYHPEQQRAWVN
jgi:uncharacterized protein (DUF433 family)